MTTKIKPLLAALAALLAAGILTVVASGCGNNSNTKSSSSAAGSAADAAFVNDMIRHHQGAIDMTEIAQTKAQHPQIKALATGIIAAQKSEIAIMKKLQNDLHSVGGHSAHMGMSQSEMGMDGSMPMLENASQFDKAFIDMMIPHHRGAIGMARRQIADGKAARTADDGSQHHQGPDRGDRADAHLAQAVVRRRLDDERHADEQQLADARPSRERRRPCARRSRRQIRLTRRRDRAGNPGGRTLAGDDNQQSWTHPKEPS